MMNRDLESRIREINGLVAEIHEREDRLREILGLKDESPTIQDPAPVAAVEILPVREPEVIRTTEGLALERFTGKGTKPVNLCCGGMSGRHFKTCVHYVQRANNSPVKECCGTQGTFHKKECVNRPPPIVRECCGAKGFKHKFGCPQRLADASPVVAPSSILKPVVEAEKEEPTQKIVEDATISGAEEENVGTSSEIVNHSYVCISCDKEWKDAYPDFDALKEKGCPGCGMHNIFQTD